MGRPTRKQVASTIVLKDPNGDVFFFEIDKKGNSKKIGDDHKKIFLENNFFNSQTLLLSSNDVLSEASNKEQEISKDNEFLKNQQNSKQYELEIEQFNLFLEKIDKHINLDYFCQEYKLSNNMLLPFDV